MRAKQFLSEAGLKTKDFYERYRLVNLIQKLSKKEPFLTVNGENVVVPATRAEIAALKAELTKFVSDEPKAKSSEPIVVPPTIGGVRLSTLQKTKDFGGTLAVSTTGEMDYSKANLGPTVEALKSFAIYAKLVIRNKDVITAEDVIKIGKLADENSQEVPQGKSKTPTTLAVYVKNVSDVTKTVKDKITLKVALSTPSFKRAVMVTPADKAAWGNLQGIISYVNTESDIGKYSRYFSHNGKRDPLNISVVGISGAKTDISSTYVDKDGHEKPLKNLSMSVKSAGAEWYDQASGNNAEGIRKFYSIIGLGDDAANNAMEQVGFVEGGRSDTDKQFADRLKKVTNLYGIAAAQLKSAIPQLNDKGEANYIKRFLAQLKSSLAGDESLVYVKFDANGTYEKLKPQVLAHLAKVIDLDVKVNDLTGTERARITWFDSKSGKELIYVVLLKNPPNRRLTHQFNLARDFFDLLRAAASASRKFDTPTAAPAPQAPTPAPTAVAPKPAPQPAAPVKAVATPAQLPSQPVDNREDELAEIVRLTGLEI